MKNHILIVKGVFLIPQRVYGEDSFFFSSILDKRISKRDFLLLCFLPSMKELR